MGSRNKIISHNGYRFSLVQFKGYTLRVKLSVNEDIQFDLYTDSDRISVIKKVNYELDKDKR